MNPSGNNNHFLVFLSFFKSKCEINALLFTYFGIGKKFMNLFNIIKWEIFQKFCSI